jgi:hypothetical protein
MALINLGSIKQGDTRTISLYAVNPDDDSRVVLSDKLVVFEAFLAEGDPTPIITKTLNASGGPGGIAVQTLPATIGGVPNTAFGAGGEVLSVLLTSADTASLAEDFWPPKLQPDLPTTHAYQAHAGVALLGPSFADTRRNHMNNTPVIR